MKKINLILTLVLSMFVMHSSFGQILYPGGDTCTTAIPIPVGDNFFTPDDGPGSSHWYSFVAPCDGDLIVRDTDDSISSGRRIHSGVCGSLVLEAEETWVVSDLTYTMTSGESIYIEVEDTWDNEALFNIEFDGCEEIDSMLLDISGTVYYDLNNNGVRDVSEVGTALNLIHSNPDGIFTVTGDEGFYYSSVAALTDGAYEIYPQLADYWSISSDSLVYNITVDDSYEQRDSLDFGLHPDTLIYEWTADLINGFPRCNDTINYWLNIKNTGTTISSGLVHLELDDSLYYVSSAVSPDSIVGQNLYWSYTDLFFNEFQQINIQVGTPDGLEDTVTSNLNVTIIEDEVEMFTETVVSERVILCAYDPNDKTPTPLGVGEFGYISPETESIEYLIRFQNTGTDTAFTVVIKDELDENLDWYSLSPLAYSHDMQIEMDVDGEVSFIFENIMLPDSNVNEVASHGFVKYRIDLKPDLPLETSIFNTANIYFDMNPAVVTNTTVNTLHIDAASANEYMDNQTLLVYPNPFGETTTVYFGNDVKNHSLKIVDLLGNQVYYKENLTGDKLEINAEQFKKGMYILILVDNDSNEIISNTKLIAN